MPLTKLATFCTDRTMITTIQVFKMIKQPFKTETNEKVIFRTFLLGMLSLLGISAWATPDYLCFTANEDNVELWLEKHGTPQPSRFSIAQMDVPAGRLLILRPPLKLEQLTSTKVRKFISAMHQTE